jgi:hypothetical protein
MARHRREEGATEAQLAMLAFAAVCVLAGLLLGLLWR